MIESCGILDELDELDEQRFRGSHACRIGRAACAEAD